MKNTPFPIISFRSICVSLVLLGTLPACSVAQSPSGSDPGTGGPNTLSATQDAANHDADIALVVTPAAEDLPRCTPPWAPVLESLPTYAVLPVFAAADDQVQVGIGLANASEPAQWDSSNSLLLPSEPSNLQVFAELTAVDCPSTETFSHLYSIDAEFAPAAGQPGSTAISESDPRIAAWGSSVVEVSYGENVGSDWKTPERALGAAAGNTNDVVSLGEGGFITMAFDSTLIDGPGYDFAVFENGFSDDYLELAFVEVSSDGTHFVRFDTASLTNESVAAYGTIDPRRLQGFAGKYRVGWATPFDLAWLQQKPEVRAHLVDLSNITMVRLIDIVGDGSVRDSLGHVVYDPYPTTDSAGFDLEAVGLINVAP